LSPWYVGHALANEPLVGAPDGTNVDGTPVDDGGLEVVSGEPAEPPELQAAASASAVPIAARRLICADRVRRRETGRDMAQV
jgi:hypothetical protein